jgi:hypothetical protein
MEIEATAPPAEVIVDSEDVEDVAFDQEVIEKHYGLTSYGADFLVDGLINRIDSKDIVVPTFDPDIQDAQSGIQGFQRQFVWSKAQCDRFIESLLLGLPVPEIFLIRERNNVLLVLDGQQRLLTLQAFRRGLLRGKEFRLQYARKPFRGNTYDSLDAEDRRRLDNAIIHATILRPDEGPGNLEAVYLIFERINSAGTPLLPHEIRIALNRGKLIDLVRELNQTPDWRALYGPPSPRFKDHELILRFIALFERGAEYSRPMKVFLNEFAADFRNPSDDVLERFGDIFCRTTATINSHISNMAFRPVKALNAAVADSVMVGIARNLTADSLCPVNDLFARYSNLMNNHDYREATDRSTAEEENVRTRLTLATEAFSSEQ